MRNRSFPPVPARNAARGFSLIEIILVVVLIGGIVAFAASRILGGGDRAKANLANPAGHIPVMPAERAGGIRRCANHSKRASARTQDVFPDHIPPSSFSGCRWCSDLRS